MDEKKQNANFTSFSISLMDNNTGKLYEILPIYLQNHPCEYANKIYKLGFKPVSYTHLTLPTNREV